MFTRPDATRGPRHRIGLTEAAQHLGISYARAHRLLLLGILPGRKLGERWFVSRHAVRRLGRFGLFAGRPITEREEVPDEADHA